MMKQYDYLIVGVGLFGPVFAHQMVKKDKKCLVMDKRERLGRNIHCENIEGIRVRKYGPIYSILAIKRCGIMSIPLSNLTDIPIRQRLITRWHCTICPSI